MTQVSRKGFVDKNGQQVVIVPKLPGATAGNLASFDAEGNLQDSGKAIDQNPTIGSTNLVTSGGVYSAVNNRMAISRDSLDSVVGIQVAHTAQDEEFDEAYIIGDDRIMLGLGEQASNKKIYIDMSNVENLECALLGLNIAFVRDENGDYAINSNLKEYLNDLLEEMPADKCVPCVVHAQWWNGSSYDSGHFPGLLCRHNYTSPGIPRTIYLSFLGNLFYATRTASNDFPNTWTKFENPFATV